MMRRQRRGLGIPDRAWSHAILIRKLGKLDLWLIVIVRRAGIRGKRQAIIEIVGCKALTAL